MDYCHFFFFRVRFFFGAILFWFMSSTACSKVMLSGVKSPFKAALTLPSLISVSYTHLTLPTSDLV